ncbi:SWIM zinc finger family protein [Spirulina sp. CS-785/01]|uniref:SWIM zinc finger family protein n=1 Tax=Spirulina sp. CS-785/01 TaxID=3021716 RepID=UPI00232E4469|nr:SWIM zinc finger family protein [Spirulina sp. CS-785/01]MDB9311849.1 SWIM zinc finger family protein [Spirulina sp. CS-785/01]
MSNYVMETREWWVERWLELLDSYRFKKRLERARRYASEGNVLSIDFKGHKVIAQVKGSDAEPYQVSLSLDQFTKEDWRYVIETMSAKALYSAQLLAGEMPSNIEEVFTMNGLSLFPFSLSEIHSRCTCPDQANPCKHIGAVYYELGDRFSEDPFVLFQLRGRTKEDILDSLRQIRSTGKIDNPKQSKKKRAAAKKQAATTPLHVDPFWEYDEPLDASLVATSLQKQEDNATSPDHKTLLDILGSLPLPTVDAALVKEYLDKAYTQASQQAIAVALKRD